MKLLHRHDAKLTALEELTGKMQNSPAFKTMMAAEAAETLKKRKAAAERLEALRQKDQVLAGDEAIQVVVARLADLEKNRQKLLDELSKQRGAKMRENAGIAAKIHREEGFLFETADSQIDTAIEFFRDKLDFLRKPGRISSEKAGLIERNIFSETVRSAIQSNRQAVNDAMRYCMDSIKALEASKLAPEIDIERIEKMKSGVPAIDVYSSIETSRKMPGTKTPSWEMLIPSDGALDYTKRKLLEKADKILQKRAA